MSSKLLLALGIFSLTICTSCKKDNDSESECSSTAATVRVISNKQATIKLAGGKYYIVEDGAIDTKLIPCSLPQSFQVENLRVVISGDVKSTVRNTGEPCCSDYCVITSIL